MGQESRKALSRRVREGYFEKYLVGDGIDIGCGDDPVTPHCMRWDREQGDAQTLPGLLPESFDWVYSSHCLEDLPDPQRALLRWWEVLRPGGYLLVVVPDEDLYEQGFWPSRFNPAHRWTFTAHKSESWSPASIRFTDIISPLPRHKLVWLRTCDYGYDYTGGVWDRTGTNAEVHIEALVQKIDAPQPRLARETDLRQTLWSWWGQPGHPAEWDGRYYGGGKGSQRFWEYLWALGQLPPCRRILDVGAGQSLFLPDLLSTQIDEVWAVDPQIPPSRQNARYRAQTLSDFVNQDVARMVDFDCVTCISVLEHIDDKPKFCRELDSISAPIVMTFELAYEANLVTMPMVYDCFAQFQNHYVSKMEVCPVWADNSGFGQWRPIGVTLEMKR